jgi:hypothetical protein
MLHIFQEKGRIYMKRIFSVTTSLALSVSLLSGFGVQTVAATESLLEEPIEQEMESITVSQEYIGPLPTEPVVIEDNGGLELEDTREDATFPQSIPDPNDPTRVIVNPGSMDYVLIDSFTGDSGVFVNSATWVNTFAANAIPLKLFKNIWSQAAGIATFNSFLKPPTKKYYRTKIYQAQDYYYYYGKAVSYEYSDSARTKLTKTTTHLSRVSK